MAEGSGAGKLPENVVENERTGERIVFREPVGGGVVLPFDFVVRPAGGVAMRHFHANQRELFRCQSGELTVHLEKGDRVLRAGEELELSPGMMHAFTNRGSVDAVCYVEYRPAGRNEAWLKLINAIERKLGREPGLLDLAPFIGDVGIYIEGPPVWAQRAMFAGLRVVATLLGKKRAGLAAASELYGRPFAWD